MIQLEMTNTAETEVTYSWNFRQYYKTEEVYVLTMLPEK